MLLARAGSQTLRRVDLVDGLQLTASGVTRLLDGLEARGLVGRARCSADARVTYAVLTVAGREKLQAAATSHAAAVRALFEERFDERELAQLAELLSRLPAASLVCEG
jgi:DNA-binding MarR family transcriptional regulator